MYGTTFALIQVPEGGVMETKSENAQTSRWGVWDGTRLLWATAILLAIGVFSLAWIGSTLTDGTLSRSPAGRSMDSLDARLKAAEQKWNAGLQERAIVAERINQVEKSASSNVRRARTEASALIEGMKRETSRNFEGVQSRVSGMESTQLELHAEVARLREELAAIRQELEAVRQANAATTARIP